MASAQLAGLVGRPDLSSSFNAILVRPDGTTAMGGNMGPSIGAGAGPSASYGASVQGDVSLGQTSLGMVAGMILTLALFYVWTRGRQV